jgi:hypothetical protein
MNVVELRVPPVQIGGYSVNRRTLLASLPRVLMGCCSFEHHALI